MSGTRSELTTMAEAAVAARDWETAGANARLAMSGLDEEEDEALRLRVLAVAEKVAPHEPATAFEIVTTRLRENTDAGRTAAAALLRRISHHEETAVASVGHAILGKVFSGEFGGAPDRVRALRHFEQGARLGDGEAAFDAAVAHRYGLGTPIDRGAAERLFRQAMDQDAASPELRLELAVLLAAAGHEEEAGLFLDPEDGRESAALADVIDGWCDDWPSVEAFCADFDRRRVNRIAMAETVAGVSDFHVLLCINADIRAQWLVDFASVFMGWPLTAVDPLAAVFGDRIADVQASDGARYPIFAIPALLDGAEDTERDVMAVIAGRHDRAVLMSPYLCEIVEGRRTLLACGLLLHDGAWSEFALMPGGFDRVLRQAGDLDRDPDAYFDAHAMRNMPAGLASWMRDKGDLAGLRAMTEAVVAGRPYRKPRRRAAADLGWD